jgi:hypothetical protein
MNRDEYNKLFHKVGLNRVAFKAVNDCDEEILVLVNAAIAAERKEWQGLTMEEVQEILTDPRYQMKPFIVHAVEAKLKEKNT